MLLHPSMTFWLAEQQVDSLAHSASDIERKLRKELDDIEIRRKRLGRKQSPEKEELLMEWVYVDETLTQNLRYSLFIALYAQFEQALYHICEDFRERFGVVLLLSDLSGQGIRKYQTFFKRVLNMSFPDDEPEWDRILKLGELRNHLVHKNRWVTSQNQDKNVLNILQRERYVSACVPGEIQFDKRFIPNVAVLFSSFLIELGYRSVEDVDSFGKDVQRRLSLKRVKDRIKLGVNN